MHVPAPRFVALLVALAVGVGVMALWPKPALSVEEAVEQRLAALSHSAEEKDLSALSDGLSEQFRSTQGWNREDARRVVAGQVLRGTWLRVFVVDVEVEERSPTEAAFVAKFIFARSEAERFSDLAKENVTSAYRIEGTFVKEADGTWRITRAAHRALSPASLF